MDKKKGQSNKKIPQLSSEKNPSEILAHEELTHEDKDPTYPFDPVKDEKGKTLYPEKQDSWKSNPKNKHKKN